jgi:hypothetical protein
VGWIIDLGKSQPVVGLFNFERRAGYRDASLAAEAESQPPISVNPALVRLVMPNPDREVGIQSIMATTVTERLEDVVRVLDQNT